MHLPYLFWLVVASVQAVSVSIQPIAKLQTRDEFGESSSTSSSYSFSSVTETYESVTNQFSDTRSELESQTSIQGAVNVLDDFRQNLLGVVSQYSEGCSCDATQDDGPAFNEMVRDWFLELETMVETMQQKFPDTYSDYCSNIFSQIGGGIQTALAVGYDAGIDVDGFVGGLNLNQELLSTVKIQATSFTSISTSTTSNSMFGTSLAAASGGSASGGSSGSHPPYWKGRALRHHANLVKAPVKPIRGSGADRTLHTVSASAAGKTVAPHAPVDKSHSHSNKNPAAGTPDATGRNAHVNADQFRNANTEDSTTGKLHTQPSQTSGNHHNVNPNAAVSDLHKPESTDLHNLESTHGSDNLGSTHGSSNLGSTHGSDNLASTHGSSNLGSTHGSDNLGSTHGSGNLDSSHGSDTLRQDDHVPPATSPVHHKHEANLGSDIDAHTPHGTKLSGSQNDQPHGALN